MHLLEKHVIGFGSYALAVYDNLDNAFEALNHLADEDHQRAEVSYSIRSILDNPTLSQLDREVAA